MPERTIDIGVVTDEVSRDLREALELSASWGLSLFELREGGKQRFPYFKRDEVEALEAALQGGARVTAVSPGILKGAADDEARLRQELDEVLPRSLDLAVHLGCPLLIVFGFEMRDDEPEDNRVRAMKAFERAAERAAEAGLRVAIENEPKFWIDEPAPSVAMLEEIGHPGLGLNWDPANMHWGGVLPTRDDLVTVLPRLFNLHVKDYYPERPEAPWIPVGEGSTPWPELFRGVVHDTELSHVTLETHCVPLAESSRRSLEGMRRLLEEARVEG